MYFALSLTSLLSGKAMETKKNSKCKGSVIRVITCIYRNNSFKLEDDVKVGRENLFQKTEKLRQRLLGESKKKVTVTSDKRVTGSQVIDESLQEILDFVLRDYVEPWYSVLTNDEEFTKSVRDTAQKIAINIANRVKGVDWIPYLTTRLVDDAASHMRLYRQTRARLKQVKGNQTYKVSSSSSTSGGTPKKTPTHRRNKSETDVFWYSQSKFYIPNLTALNEPTKNVKETETLEKIFFDLEVQMEKNLICRDLVCTDEAKELAFLGEIAEVLLFLLLPKADFDCLTVRFILRELLVNVIIRPLLDLFSDPDYINQTFIWLCTKEATLRSDIFLTVIRTTDSLEELAATKSIVCKEIAYLRSKDSGHDDDLTVKQQLNSLLYVKKILDSRIISMKEGLDASESDGAGPLPDWNRLLVPGHKLVNLPLDELLKNNIALSYFIDYMTSVSAEAYLYFYLNIYGWRVSAEQQISDIELQKLQNSQTGSSSSSSLSKKKNSDLENLKEAATKIYQQYLSDKNSSKLQLDDNLVKNLVVRIKTESVKETWFDELQACCYEKLQNEDKFLPAFKRSVSYLRLLAELDLLKDPTSEDDSKSLDSISLSSINNELDVLEEHVENQKDGEKSKIDGISISRETKSKSSSCDDLDDRISRGSRSSRDSREDRQSRQGAGESDNISEGKDVVDTLIENNADQFLRLDDGACDQSVIKKLQQGRFDLNVEIIETGIVNDKGKTYGIYAVAVSKVYDSGYQEKWHIYRR
ncbi:sorting nexin-13-like [Copidosoma floridanum]|uniref:sorting nexin-13-like n=1 Tax=Copidosoma floridanum TaxID=29053 RepID=UPI000C6FC7E0|nr:sorting nexin-13-like [Copidosoma floridanum]